MRSYIGHVYVIKFSDGLVKAGRTASPKNRINNGGYGNRTIVDYWVSLKLSDSRIMERNILSSLKKIATKQVGKEYFAGIEFDVAIEVAKGECDKEHHMFSKTAIQEASDKENKAISATINRISPLMPIRKQMTELEEIGLTAIRNSVFYSCLGIRETIERLENKIFSLELSDEVDDHLDRLMDSMDECRSALHLISKVITADFTDSEFSELYRYATKSKAMLESIRTLSSDECREMFELSSKGGAS